MKYISDASYDYIMNKYHDQAKPFDPFQRFIRRDEIFSPETGMPAGEIMDGLKAQDERIADKPHSVRKAQAFAYVLKNTRISCDRRDPFPAINMIDRPLSRVLTSEWAREVREEILPDVFRRRAEFSRLGIATIGPDYDHSVPHWDGIFAFGFAGLLHESERARVGHGADKDAFFEGIRITYEAIISFVERLSDLAARTEGSGRMAKALSSIAKNPPATFYEVLLVIYIYFMLCEHIEGLQARSLCHFDRLLYPYFENDLKNGVTEEEIRGDLAAFLLQFTAIGNYWNQPVFLGGCKEDESTYINALSYLFLDVYDQMGIMNPKVQIKVAESTPKDFLLKALDMIRRGHSSIVFVSDALIRKSLMRAGATPEQARLCDIKGCYEYSILGGIDVGMNYVNLLKPLEYVLHEGCDGVMGEFALHKSPPPCAYKSFDELYAEYKLQLGMLIDAVIDIVNGFEEYLAYMNPQSMLSAAYPTCLQRGRDALAGGSLMNVSSLGCGFIADLADSFAMIKKYVFEKGEISLPEFVRILDSNYEGEELFRRKLVADRDKYGNNKDLPDSIATDIVSFITERVCGKPNAAARGGTWECGFHVARQSYFQGERTAASPNGRPLGEELSKNCSASMGQNRDGATAAILSVTKIDASAFCGDACLDLGLHPGAVKGEEGLEAMYGLLMTFLKRGGHAMHINVFDADTLRDAQAHPEKYGDLQIRVCGWNVHWNQIPKEEQDGFIRQAEALLS